MNENLLTTVVPGAIIVISLPICSAMNLASRDNTPRGVLSLRAQVQQWMNITIILPVFTYYTQALQSALEFII